LTLPFLYSRIFPKQIGETMVIVYPMADCTASAVVLILGAIISVKPALYMAESAITQKPIQKATNVTAISELPNKYPNMNSALKLQKAAIIIAFVLPILSATMPQRYTAGTPSIIMNAAS